MLYLVPVPIGNLDDITFRALKVLQSADVIACEDTRSTGQLLKHYKIVPKKLISLHEHNEIERGNFIVSASLEGKKIALVSDAGSPCISDPGARLVSFVLSQEITVVPLPGATAFVPALSASGFPTDQFTFLGFPPQKKGRQSFLKSALEREETLILYESSHRIVKLLQELCALDASERKICICRELTKMHEEFLRGTAQECLEILAKRDSQKGEFVVILAGTS